MGYIDADKLKAEIERLKDKHWDNLPDADSPEYSWTHNELFVLGAYKELEHIEDFIDSLQQEQSCDTCSNDKGCVACKDGELWEGKGKPSEDLEEAVISIWKSRGNGDASQLVPFSYDEVVALMRTGAEWQKEQMPSDEEMKCALRMEYEKGVFDTKQQMLKDAWEREVKIDSGGYPYIDITAELYDYEHDVPLAKEGELVKIIIVKEGEE